MTLTRSMARMPGSLLLPKQPRCGIYAIRHIESRKPYVGSSNQIEWRWYIHRRLLAKKAHHSIYLQHAWDKYGQDAFEFTVLELVEDESKLTEQEQFWIDSLDAFGFGYNMSPTANSQTGYRHTLDTKAKISAKGKGRKATQEALENMRISMLGKNRGKKHSEATKAKISAKGIGRVYSAEARANMGASHLGKPGGMRGKKHRPESIAKLSASITEYHRLRRLAKKKVCKDD